MQNTLKCKFESKKNNLNFMRFVAAILVIVCHSFPLCYGENQADFLSVYTDGMLNLGDVAVGLFFVTGGFLIAGSAERKQTCKNFFKARIIRIFPSLFLVIVVLTFVLGPIITTCDLVEYFTSSQTYRFLLNAILILQHNLPGVFENNVYPNVVNGPLWTLPIEFLCYIGCFSAYKMKIFDTKKYRLTIPFAIVGIIGVIVLFYNNAFVIRVIRPVFLYYIGIGYYIYREQIRLDYRVFGLTVACFILGIIFKCSTLVMIIFFPYIMFFLAFYFAGKLNQFGKKYEISYGMYLWGWPIQQILVGVSPFFQRWYMNVAVSVLIVIVIGVVNNILIEKKLAKILS